MVFSLSSSFFHAGCLSLQRTLVTGQWQLGCYLALLGFAGPRQLSCLSPFSLFCSGPRWLNREARLLHEDRK